MLMCWSLVFPQQSRHTSLSISVDLPAFGFLSLSSSEQHPRIHTFRLLLQCGINPGPEGRQLFHFTRFITIVLALWMVASCFCSPSTWASPVDGSKGTALPGVEGNSQHAAEGHCAELRYNFMSLPDWPVLFCNNKNYLITGSSFS